MISKANTTQFYEELKIAIEMKLLRRLGLSDDLKGEYYTVL